MVEGNEVRQVFKELEGETVAYRATAERVKEATVVEQVNEDGAVVLEVKLDDPGDRLHGFSDEEVAMGLATRTSTHGNAPGQWFMPTDQNDEVSADIEPVAEGTAPKDEPTV